MMAWTSPALILRLMPRRISLPLTLACRFLISNITHSTPRSVVYGSCRHESRRLWQRFAFRSPGFDQKLQHLLTIFCSLFISGSVRLAVGAEFRERYHKHLVLF